MGLHARYTEEAIAVEQETIGIPVEGKLSSGDSYATSVNIPQAFTYGLLKLFAFNDRHDDAEKNYARHHALDLYTIISLTSESEYETCKQLRSQLSESPILQQGATIVAEYFSTQTALGVLRLKEHPLYSENLQVGEFLLILKEFYGIN